MISLLSNPLVILAIVMSTLELVSKRLPSFKGAWVLGASFLLSVGLAMLYQLSIDPKGWSTGLMVGIVVFVSASGGKDLVGSILGKMPATPTTPDSPPKE